MSRPDWPHRPSEAPLAMWSYVAVSVCGAIAQTAVVGGAVTWVLAVPGSVAFGYLLLHGVRVLRQIALLICAGSLFFAPAARGPIWLSVFSLIGLVLLLLPASREYCATNSATPLSDT
jgi:hypothetical protein